MLEKSLKMLEFGLKNSRPLKVLENRQGPRKYLKSPRIFNVIVLENEHLLFLLIIVAHCRLWVSLGYAVEVLLTFLFSVTRKKSYR